MVSVPGGEDAQLNECSAARACIPEKNVLWKAKTEFFSRDLRSENTAATSYPPHTHPYTPLSSPIQTHWIKENPELLISVVPNTPL